MVRQEIENIENISSKKRTNEERAERPTKPATNCKVKHAHIEQETKTNEASKEQGTSIIQMLGAQQMKPSSEHLDIKGKVAKTKTHAKKP
eukprot:16286163-Heterocapsa_arctica.AAC.2